jgi:hypothetical protein
MASAHILQGTGGPGRRRQTSQRPSERQARWRLLTPPEWSRSGADHRRATPIAVSTDLLPALQSLSGVRLKAHRQRFLSHCLHSDFLEQRASDLGQRSTADIDVLLAEC